MADINNLLNDIEENDDDVLQDEIVDTRNESLLQAPNLSENETAEVPRELRNAEMLRDKTNAENEADNDGDDDGSRIDAMERADGMNDNTQTAGDIFMDDDHFELDHDYQELRRLWIQEKNCPELLPHNTEIMNHHIQLLNDKEDIIDELQDQAAEPRTPGNSDPLLASLVASIHKVEADRIRFILADLTRIRLGKIENHALHNRTLLDRMSDQEVRLYNRCTIYNHSNFFFWIFRNE